MRKPKILLVYPDREFVAGAMRELSSRGMDVITASDALHGVEAFKREEPQLVIVGLALPGGGGIRIHEHMRQTGHASTPIIHLAVKDASAESQRRAAAALDPAAILDLPLSPAQLARHATKVLNTAGGSAPTRKSATFRVLVVEDDADQRDAIHACLNLPGRDPIEVTFAPTVRKACDLLRHLRYDCVLIDHLLTDGVGLDVLEQTETDLINTPVIGLSASSDPQTAINYFRSGCTEFFNKCDALQTDHLRRRVTEVVSQFQRRAMMIMLERSRLGDSIMQSQESLVALARTDRLTGISNRAVFDDALLDRHAKSSRTLDPFALCMIDVDHFKQYNDRYGHAAGDQTLRTIGQTLAATLHENDLVCRIGGEEFAVILDTPDPALAFRAADRLRQRIAAESILHELNPPHDRATISIGVAMFDPDSPLSPAALMHSADEAMYRAKTIGRNCVVLAEATRAAQAHTAEPLLTSAAHRS